MDAQESFKSSGFVILDDFLPPDEVEYLAGHYETAEFDQLHDQVREEHFKHVFKTDSEFLPSEDEHYMARFRRSSALEADERLNAIAANLIQPPLSDISEQEISGFDLRCIAMYPGDFMRTHIDDYAGTVGFILYLNRRWVWDWGGILSVADGDDIVVHGPVFNRLILIGHKQFRSPHFVNTISEYAKSPRYALIGFAQS